MTKKKALLIHGMNNPSHVMNDIEAFLLEKQFQVFNLELKGHSENLAEFQSVHFEDWLKQVDEAYKKLSQLPGELYMVGYSLGALLGLHSSLIKRRGVHKFVFLSPAFFIRKSSYLVLACNLLGKKRIVPSFSPKDCRAHSGTTVNAYNQLFKLNALFQDLIKSEQTIKKLQEFNISIFMDPRDELVSHKKLQKFILENQLGWSLHPISGQEKIKHLAVKRSHFPEIQWEQLRQCF